MIDYKLFLGVLATLIALVSYVPYFEDIFAGRTKPHAFTWFVWALLTGIAFAIQLSEHGGPGAWVTGFTALVCFIITLLAVAKGKLDFPLVDWVCLFAAFVALGLWLQAKEPVLAVVLITLADALAFLPTFRKGFDKPFEETASTFALSTLKFAIAVLALETLTVATWFYPASLVVMNGLFVLLLFVRRKQVSVIKPT